MIIIRRGLGVLLVSSIIGVSGCSNNKANSTGAASNASAVQPQAACGNDPSYTIQGNTYQVLPSASGYAEKGTAAWYGAEYQGTPTAGCEVFDMNAYSAAHRTLPLPSFAKVTNQQNGKSIIVRINDRGPFESNDLIQLSFAAATALGIRSRTGVPVSIEALETGQSQPVVSNAPPRTQPKPIQAEDKSRPFYVIAGNWDDRNVALDMFVRLTSVGLGKTEMETAQKNGRNIYQVRVGPLYNQDQIDNVKDMLESNGLANFRVVAAR